MFQKCCLSCQRESFSAYDDPKWICPYCGEFIEKGPKAAGDQGVVENIIYLKDPVKKTKRLTPKGQL